MTAGCSASSHGQAEQSVSAAVGSLTANPQFQADKVRLEANMRRGFHPAHPVASVKMVLAETFPGADLHAVLVYGVKTFKPADRKAGPARTAWENGVVLYVLNQTAQGAGSGQPTIPGVTAPVTGKSS
jgi:hypothetical protein